MNTIKSNILISIVSPVYKAEKIVFELVRRIESSIMTITDHYEIILVEDCGPDNSWKEIENISANNPKVKGFRLSRNFGQHHAITCGLDHAEGEWVVVMDCDLQDRPEEIPRLYQKAMEGFDIVFASRTHRADGYYKKLGSKLFYRLFSYLSGIDQDGSIANFGIYHKKTILAINSMREPLRGFSPMIRWVGFKSTKIDIVHDLRFEGKSSYNFSKLVNLALDIILSYSDKPLRLTVKLGFLISMSAVLFSIFMLIQYLRGEVLIAGYTSLIISIWLFSGLILFTTGILGLYISKVFDGVKNRPLYIIDKRIN